MSKHFLVSSFEKGNLLVRQESHGDLVASVQTVVDSKLFADIDITSMQLPRDVDAASANSKTMFSNSDGFWPNPASWFATYRPYIVSKGILTIPVRGALMHGLGVTIGRYATGYEYIVRAITRAEADPEVKGVVFWVDSPGGHVAGCFDTADLVFGMKKPTVAFLADMGCSAAYAIAASCNKVVGTQTVIAGNIGVLSTFIDVSENLKKNGISYEYISAPEGGNKAEGHFGTKLSKEAVARIQEEANELYEIFVACVVRGRGISDQEIRDTKALSYHKQSCLAMGLVDMVASSVDIPMVAAEVIEELENFNPSDEVAPQSAKKTEAETETSAKEKKTMTDEEMQAAIAAEKSKTAAAAAAAEAATAAAASAAKAATDRIAGILASEEGKANPALAQHFAFKTEMNVDDAKAAMAVAGASAPKPADDKKTMAESFDEQMKKTAPNLTANSPKNEGGDDKSEESLNATMALAKISGAMGYAFEK